MVSTLGAYIPTASITLLEGDGFVDTTSYFTQVRAERDIVISLGEGFVVVQESGSTGRLCRTK